MLPRSPLSAIAILTSATALLITACGATATPTSSPTDQVDATPAAQTTLIPTPSSTPPPTTVATPDATVAARPMVTAETTQTTAIDGVYDTWFTKSDLASSPLLADADEVNDGNWGDWTLVLDSGNVEYTQHNDIEGSAAAGTFSVAGDAVTLAFDAGANAGETFGFRWRLSDDVLTFRRDDTLNLPGPTPFLVTPWARRTATSVTRLASGGTMFPGRYSTRFEPGMTLTIGDEVDLDCFPGYRCRGDIDVNLPFWVEFEFGNRHGSDLAIVRMDKVYANSGHRLIDPPDDLEKWIDSVPGLTLTNEKTVTVGGIVGTQVDAHAEVDQPLGPTGLRGVDDPQWFGVGANHPTRLILLRIGSSAIMINASTGPENVTGDFDAAVEGVQPVIDSITWSTDA